MEEILVVRMQMLETSIILQMELTHTCRLKFLPRSKANMAGNDKYVRV